MRHDPATAGIYPLSLPDALPIWPLAESTSTVGMKFGETRPAPRARKTACCSMIPMKPPIAEPTTIRSEEHTSELQSRRDLVCRLLLGKEDEARQVAVSATAVVLG